MSKYMFKVNYVGELAKGLLKEGGTSRRQAIEKTFASLGGTTESLYYAFGDTDIYLIVDLPDNATAASATFLAKGSGLECIAIPLLTPEELDEAAKKSPIYRPPGQ